MSAPRPRGYFDDPDPFEALAEARAEIGRLRAALVRVEAVMSIVEPRSDKGEYLAALFDVREALGFDRKTGTRRVNK